MLSPPLASLLDDSSCAMVGAWFVPGALLALALVDGLVPHTGQKPPPVFYSPVSYRTMGNRIRNSTSRCVGPRARDPAPQRTRQNYHRKERTTIRSLVFNRENVHFPGCPLRTIPPMLSMAIFCSFTNKSYNATSVSPSPLSNDVVFIGLRGGDRQHQSQRQDLARQHHHRRHHPGELRHHRNHNPPLSHTIHSFQSPGDDIQQQFYNAQESIVKQLCPDDGNAQRPYTAVAARFLAGTLAFYTTAFSMQCAQYKILGISTGTKPGIIPVGCGIITVALGSWVGHLAGLGVVASSSSTSNVSSASLLPSSLFVQRGIISTSGFEYGIESIRNALRQLPETAGSGFKCAREMLRPMMFGLSDKNANSERERKERREAWMHTARM